MFDTAKPAIDLSLRGVKNNIDSQMCQPECLHVLSFVCKFGFTGTSLVNCQPLKEVP